MAEKKRRISELAPSPHLEAADLAGEHVVVTIKGFDWHPVGIEEVLKGVVYFEEYDRGMVINRTNCKMLQHLFGEHLDDIVGKKITLYPDTAPYAGEIVPCLRISKDHPGKTKSKTEEAAAVEA